MTWKRGTKTLSVIQQGEPFRTNPQSTGSGKQIYIDGNKSLGKKVDPVLASLRGVNSGRASISEPSSGRNSMENSPRPKVVFLKIRLYHWTREVYFIDQRAIFK